MWQSTQLFACSMCGKPNSATDAQPFCGPCETGFQQEQEQERRERAHLERLWKTGD